jgi:hypothetical protein
MKREERADLAVVCADCDLRTDLNTPNEAVAFYRRHSSITGHDVGWKRADVTGIETVPEGDLEAVISALEERFPAGVPVGVVTVVRSVQGATIGGTLEAIHERRMAGDLYEPRDDHLRVT